MIRALFELIDPQTDSSFSVREFGEEAFISSYHYHHEYELTLVNKGTGKRFIGHHMEQFSDGDMALVGSNLPHCWKPDPHVKGGAKASATVVQFANDFLGNDFFEKPELLKIKALLERSQRGIIYNKSVVPEISSDLKNLAGQESNFKKLLIFLEILHKLSVSTEFKLLNRLSSAPLQNGFDMERINRVFGYIIDNYKTSVSLDEVAQHACMTPTAFCKYFKKVTKKTFIEVVLEYRLHYATSQLLRTSRSIAQICFDCGFNDVVHFNRMFKLKYKVSPLQYKKRFLNTQNGIGESKSEEELLNKKQVI